MPARSDEKHLPNGHGGGDEKMQKQNVKQEMKPAEKWECATQRSRNGKANRGKETAKEKLQLKKGQRNGKQRKKGRNINRKGAH